MADLNNCSFSGRLTRKPELRNVKDTTLCSFAIANNGYKKDEVTYLDCEVWGKQGETINEYLDKGDSIIVRGELRIDSFNDKDGNKRTKPKVRVDKFHFVGGPKKSNTTSNDNEQPAFPLAGDDEPLPF